jgi:hypothetical protein
VAVDNEVKITVTSEDATEAGFQSAENKGRSFSTRLKDMLTRTGKEGSQALVNPLIEQLKNFNVKVTEAQGVVDGLRKKIAETGDTSLFGDLDKADANLRKLTKFRDSLIGQMGDAGDKGGESFALSFAGRVGPLIGKAPIGAPIVAGIVAAAPAVSSVLAAAVTVGVGAGVVGAGLAASATDPRVRGAAIELKKIISLNMAGIAQETFVPDTLRALSFVKGQFRSIRPDLERIFADGAKLVEPMTRALVGAGRNLLPGIEDAVDRAEPLFDVLEERIPSISSAASQIISDFSRSADDAANTLSGILALAEATLFVTGKSLALLSDNASLLGLGPLQMLGDAIRENDAHTGDWANTFGDLKESIEAAKLESQSYAETIRAQTDPTFAMIKAQKDLKVAQDEYNEALKEHGRHSPQAQEALLALGQAAIAAQTAAQGMGDEFKGRLTPAMRATLIAAGLTERQIDDLANQFERAEAAGDSYAKTYRAKIVTEYVGRPFSDFSGIGGSTNRGYAHGGIASAATGGMRSGLVEVGEHGRELVRLPPGAHVMSNPDTERALAGGGGGGVAVLEVHVMPGTDAALMNEVVKGLQFVIRTEGENDPQAFLSGGRAS